MLKSWKSIYNPVVFLEFRSTGRRSKRMDTAWFLQLCVNACMWSIVVWMGCSFCLGNVHAQVRKASEKDLCAAYIKKANQYLETYKETSKKFPKKDQKAIYKDHLLYYSALSFMKAAEHSSSTEQKLFLQEQAVKNFRLSFSLGLCEASQRCRPYQTTIERLTKQIGYSVLVVLGKDSDSSITVKGYQYQKRQSNRFKDRLRPGQYQVIIWSKNAKRRGLWITIGPAQYTLLNIRKRRVKIVKKNMLVQDKVPLLSWVGYIGGGVLAIGGTAMFVYALREQNRIDDIRSNPSTAGSISEKDYLQQFNQNRALQIAGIALGVTGVVAVIGAVIVHATSGKIKKTNQVSLLTPDSELLFSTFE